VCGSHRRRFTTRSTRFYRSYGSAGLRGPPPRSARVGRGPAGKPRGRIGMGDALPTTSDTKNALHELRRVAAPATTHRHRYRKNTGTSARGGDLVWASRRFGRRSRRPTSHPCSDGRKPLDENARDRKRCVKCSNPETIERVGHNIKFDAIVLRSPAGNPPPVLRRHRPPTGTYLRCKSFGNIAGPTHGRRIYFAQPRFPHKPHTRTTSPAAGSITRTTSIKELIGDQARNKFAWGGGRGPRRRGLAPTACETSTLPSGCRHVPLPNSTPRKLGETLSDARNCRVRVLHRDGNQTASESMRIR